MNSLESRDHKVSNNILPNPSRCDQYESNSFQTLNPSFVNTDNFCRTSINKKPSNICNKSNICSKEYEDSIQNECKDTETGFLESKYEESNKKSRNFEYDIEKSGTELLTSNPLNQTDIMNLQDLNSTNLQEQSRFQETQQIRNEDSHLEVLPRHIQEQRVQELKEKKKKLDQILRKIARSVFRKTFVLCLTILMASLFLSSYLKDGSQSLSSIFIFFYSLVFYYILENIIRFIFPDILPWKRIEIWLNTLDLCGLLVFTKLFEMRISYSEVLSAKFGSLIPLLSLTLSIWKLRPLKISKTIIKTIYTFQILLISGKIDGNFTLNWENMLTFEIFLGLVGLMVILQAIYSTFKKAFSQSPTESIRIVGFIWVIALLGLGITCFIVLIGVILVFGFKNNQNNKVFLTLCLISTQVFSFLAMLIQIVGWYHLLQFLAQTNPNKQEYQEKLGISLNDNLPLIIKTKQNFTLIKQSSTYFSFFSLKNLYKLNLTHFKIQNEITNRLETQETSNKIETGNIKVRHDQINLEIMDLPKHKNYYSQRDNLEKEVGFAISQDFVKGALSDDARGYVFESQKNNISIKENDDNLCHICCSNHADAVIEQCRHGGLCIDCAIKIINKQGICMVCRGKAQTVIKIDPNPKFNEIVKGSEIITVIPLPNDL